MVRAAVLITTSPKKMDDVAKGVDRIGVKDVLVVTGRADVVALLEGTREEIAAKIRRIFGIKGVETTETLWEVE